MPEYVIEIDGTPAEVENLSITEAFGAVSTLRCKVRSEDGTLRPADGESFVLTEDGDPLFTGTIQDPEEVGLADMAGGPAIVTDLSATGNLYYTQRRLVMLTLPAGTLKSQVELLRSTYLAEFGVTLSPTQIDGPTMPEQAFFLVRLDQVLATILTGYAYDIDHSKVLSFWVPADTPAPFNITDSNFKTVGDIGVRRSRADYANRVFVRFTESARSAYAFLTATANFTDGEQVEIGGRDYTFQTTLTDANGHIQIGATLHDSLQNLAYALDLGGTPGTNYALSMTAHTSVYAYMQETDVLIAKAITPGDNGNTIDVTETTANAVWYTEGGTGNTTSTLLLGADAATTNWVKAENLTEIAANGSYDVVLEAEDITSEDAAQTLADSYLAAHDQITRTITYATYEKGLRPGMTQTITCASRDLSALQVLITEIVSTPVAADRIQRKVTAVEGVNFKGDWRDTYTAWNGGSGGRTSAVGFVASDGSGAAVIRKVYFLGAIGNVWTYGPADTWMRADGSRAEGGIEVLIDTDERGSTTATVSVRLRARSGTVHAGLLHVATDTVVGQTSSPVSGSTLSDPVSFTVNLVAGRWAYALVIKTSVSNVDASGIGGYVE